MECNLERIQNRLNRIASFNATPGEGFTRFSYSEEDRRSRQYLISEMETLGLAVSIDGVGNIRGRLQGKNPDAAPVMTGSHIDTVLHGGRFDGTVGSVGALEVVSVLKENNLVPEIPIDVIFFAEEEGSNFNSTMAGSKALVGAYTIDTMKKIKNCDGKSMFELISSFGLQPENMENNVIKHGDVAAMLELHIEQGAVLDSEGLSIGIVEGIFGSKCLQVTVTGEPNHAGATPMYLRRDPMQAAAALISNIDKIAKAASETTVATVGKIKCMPDISNCIAGKVIFTVDIRDIKKEGIETVCNEVALLAEKLEKEYGVTTQISLLAESAPVLLSGRVSNTIEEAVKQKGCPYKRMNSGAVHDSAMLNGITDVGMIFIPSMNGRSHVPEEDTKWEDIKLGCDILLTTVTKLATVIS